MTVTELREALQKLEAEGHGALPIGVRVGSADGSEAELQAAESALIVTYGDSPSDIYERDFKRGQRVVCVE